MQRFAISLYQFVEKKMLIKHSILPEINQRLGLLHPTSTFLVLLLLKSLLQKRVSSFCKDILELAMKKPVIIAPADEA